MEAAEKAMFSVINLDEALDKSPNGLSEREKKMRRSVNLRPVCFKDIIKYIELQDMDSELKAVLKKQVSRYPAQALQRYADNFDQMVNAAQRKIRKNYVVQPTFSTPTEDTRKPGGQYVRKLKVEPKMDENPIVMARKVDFDSQDDSFDLMATPLESLGIPINVSVEVHLKQAPPVVNSSSESLNQRMPFIAAMMEEDHGEEDQLAEEDHGEEDQGAEDEHPESHAVN